MGGVSTIPRVALRELPIILVFGCHLIMLIILISKASFSARFSVCVCVPFLASLYIFTSSHSAPGS